MSSSRRLRLASFFALACAVLSGGALAAPEVQAGPAAWTRGEAANVVADGALVVHAVVPLCDNDQIDCGSTKAGEPENLEHNLYWGAVFGHKRFFGRKASAYRLVSTTRAEKGVLERAVYRRSVSGKPFGREGDIEVVVVLDAIAGGSIDGAVDALFRMAERGGAVAFRDGEADRRLRVDVAVYAGHNRMMDGKMAAAALADDDERRAPIPAVILACDSRSYFREPLEARGSYPVVLTRDLMAPEGYVLEAAVEGLARNEPRQTIRKRVVAAYAKWQRIEEKTAGSIFANLD